MDDKHKTVRGIVKKDHAKASSGCRCCCNCNQYSNEDFAKPICYSGDEIKSVSEWYHGLGCGNTTRLVEINEVMAGIRLRASGYLCYSQPDQYSIYNRGDFSEGRTVIVCMSGDLPLISE